VTSIEHAYSLPDEVLRMMAQKGISLVPTDLPLSFTTIRRLEHRSTLLRDP